MKKGVVISVIVISIIIIGIISFFTWIALMDDPSIPPDLPIESKSGKITITSNGCCMWVDDFKVIATSDYGDEIVIAEVPKITVYDIFNFEMPVFDNVYSNITISCTYYYGDYYEFNEVVFTVEDIGNNGLLLYIQEGDGAYFNAKSGNKQVSYKLNHDTHNWDKLNTPTTLYKRG